MTPIQERHLEGEHDSRPKLFFSYGSHSSETDWLKGLYVVVDIRAANAVQRRPMENSTVGPVIFLPYPKNIKTTPLPPP